MYRRARIESPGSEPVLQSADVPDLAPGEVQISIRAAALNFADLLKAQGRYQEAEPFPFTPGLEGAGEIVAADKDTGFAIGQRVAVNFPGTLAELVNAPATACVPIPDQMTLEQAAGFQIAYGTSHLALTLRAGLQAGETLVVLGAAGGVGLTAVQIGAALGAKVIGIARGASKLQAVQNAGAQITIDSGENTNLRNTLKEIGGVDVIYDPVGGEPGLDAFGALKRGGRYLVIGFAGGKPPALPLNHALVKNIAIHGFYWGGYRQLDPAVLRASMTELLGMVADGRLSPLEYEIMPLADVAMGFARLRERSSIGKIVITI